MNQTLERLHDIEKNGYQIDFANIFNHAFENYKKIALYAGLVLFIFIVLLTVFMIGSLISVIGVAAVTQELSPEKFKIENLSESNLLFIGIASIGLGCLLSPFQAAFLKMADCAEKDQEFSISNLFSYYKLPHLIEIMFSTLLISAASFAQATLFTYIKFEILGSIFTYFISFITLLTVPLIIFGNLRAVEAIKYSIILVFKEPIVLLGLMVVTVIGSFVGLIGCCIGMFFTIPIFYSMNYAIYSAIVGIDTPQEIE